ncbi:hypothetical protein MNBD_PLANCTO02-642 [hydrothermal vent metagenome]|uniref:Carrier domain-containing protein n=1 Tax=hydrothermal vent metagenome TaxID=652676 RepID=A0A3B1DL98_9ZZZZ
MGLDSVELIMDVEDHFGITITEEEWESSLSTVGSLVERCRQRILVSETRQNIYLPYFFALRDTLREMTLNRLLRVRPSTPIVNVLPSSLQHQFWDQLSEQFHLDPPSFRFWSKQPIGFKTVGDITRQIAKRHLAIKPFASSEYTAVLNELRPIIMNALNVKEDEVVPTARFVEDLGMS